MDQLTPGHPNVRWHSADLNAGWLSPTGYYWIPEAWGHTSSDAPGGGPCRHATSVALAADLTRTWAVAISGTVPDQEEVAAPPPPPAIWRPQAIGPYGGCRSHPPPSATRGSRAGHGGSPRARRRWATRCPCDGFETACTREGNTPSTHFGLPEPPPTTATPYCTSGLGGIPGHRPAEQAPRPQPRRAHSRRS